MSEQLREESDRGGHGEEVQAETDGNADGDKMATKDKMATEPATDRGPPDEVGVERGDDDKVGGSAAGGRGRPEGRRADMPGRSRSVDCGGSTPNEGRRTGVLAFSGNVGGSVPTRTGAGLSRAALALERATWGASLPSRLRSGSESGPSGSTEPKSIWERIEKLYGSDKADVSARTKRNSVPIVDWSLAEGEEQGTAAYRRRSATDSPSPPSVFSQGRGVSSEGGAGETLPGRIVRGERVRLDSGQGPGHSPETDATRPVNSPAPVSSSRPSLSVLTRQRPPGTQPEGQAQGTQPELRETPRSSGVLGYCTRSLDRTRGKLSTAAQTRAAMAADTHAASHPPLGEEMTTPVKAPTHHPPPPGDREERWRDRRNKYAENREERSSRMNDGGERMRDGKAGSSVHKMESVQELEKEKRSDLEGVEEVTKDVEKEVKPPTDPPGVNSGSNPVPTNQGEASARNVAAASVGRACSRKGSFTEEVFAPRTPAPQASVKKKVPEKLPLPSVASVRNKIHQFEALTQKAQFPSLGGFLKPRRAFSVPEQMSRAGEGVLKSGSDRTLGGLRERWERGNEGDGVRGEGSRGNVEGVKKSASEKSLGSLRSRGGGENMKDRGWGMWSASVDEAGMRQGMRDKAKVAEEGVAVDGKGRGDGKLGIGRSKLKGEMEIPLNGGIRGRAPRNSFRDQGDSTGAPHPEKTPTGTAGEGRGTSSSSPRQSNSNNNANGEACTAEKSGVRSRLSLDQSLPGSDDDKTPTNTPQDSPFHPQVDAAPAWGGQQRDTGCSPAQSSSKAPDSLDLPLPLTSSSPSGLPPPRPEDAGVNMEEWVASLNQKIEQWNRGEEDVDSDDDHGTEKDDDSHYDSDESSVTITSNMSSQSDRKSFCLSLADLCNFGGVDYESDAESEDWSTSGRSLSLSSDVSALSCVSVLGSNELDRLLDEVKGLGDETLQNYEDVQVVVLHKEVGVGLGFTMAGGVDQNKPITVHKVFPSGVAAQEGSIREGDRVLSINGTALCSSAHWEALRTLRRARSLGMGVVVLRRAGAAPPSKGGATTDPKGQRRTPPTNTGERVCVRLEKSSRDLGFSLEGGLGSSLGDRPLSIQKIFLGGPVSQVSPGDEVLEIQGVSVVGMMRLEAWTLIRKLPPGPVEVVLHRPVKPPSAS